MDIDVSWSVVSDHVNQRHVSEIKMELLELQCTQEKYTSLLNLVSEPLNRMSTCRLPPAVSSLSDFAFQVCTLSVFLAHDSMLSALYAIAHPSVHPSVCPSHGWINRKWLKLGSCNFHCTVASSL